MKSETVPYAMEKALSELEKSYVISPIQHSKLASPIAPVAKADGSVRICGDFKANLNQAVLSLTTSG